MDKSTLINTRVFGLSGCYIYKSQLREYTHKVGMTNPVYETINEGPSHEPCFRSTVILDNARYDSLPGFPKRKASEQSAAEVALIDLAKSRNTSENIASLLESGLCKQLLQQYAHKMKFTLPTYVCRYDFREGKIPFTCTVEIGGSLYGGASAKSYKAARIDAAKTALLALQSNLAVSEANLTENSQYVVIPIRKKKVIRIRTKTTPFNLKQNFVWRRKVEKKFPSDMFDKLRTFVAEQGVAGGANTFDLQVKSSGSPLANMARNGVVNLKVHSQPADVPCKKNLEPSGNETTCIKPKMAQLWREVESKLTGAMFDKLGSLVSKRGVSDENDTYTEVVKAQDVGRGLNIPNQANGIQKEDSGKSATEVNPNLSILSQFQIEDLMVLAAEIHKYCGSGAVAPTTTTTTTTAPQSPFLEGERVKTG